jgi:hypothetical protein
LNIILKGIIVLRITLKEDVSQTRTASGGTSFFLLNNKPFWEKNIIIKEKPLKRQQKQSTHYEKKKF